MRHRRRIITALLAFAAALAAMFAVERTAHHNGEQRGNRSTVVDGPQPDQIDRLTITRRDVTIQLDRSGKIWRMTKPLRYLADTPAVERALKQLRNIHLGYVVADFSQRHPDLQVDSRSGLHVEVGAKNTVMMDLILGRPIDDGVALRIHGRRRVYQTQLSLRTAFDRPPRLWRNRSIVRLRRAAVRTLTIATPDETMVFSRQSSRHPWHVREENGSPVDVDEQAVNQLLGALSALDANDFADGLTAAAVGLDPPQLELRAQNEGADPPQLVLRLSRGTDGDSYVQRQGMDQIFVVRGGIADRLMTPPRDYRDKTVTHIDRQQVVAITISRWTGGRSSTVQVLRDDGRWQTRNRHPVEASVMDTIIDTLGNLRADQITSINDRRPDNQPSLWRYHVALADGSRTTLVIGGACADSSCPIRVVGRRELYLVPSEAVGPLMIDPTHISDTKR